jgi:hypothetical protein
MYHIGYFEWGRLLYSNLTLRYMVQSSACNQAVVGWIREEMGKRTSR